MTTDTRTEAERRYDETRLSRQPIDADIPLSADEERVLNILLTNAPPYDMERLPFGHLPDGTPMYGDLETFKGKTSRYPVVAAQTDTWELCADQKTFAGQLFGTDFRGERVPVVTFDGFRPADLLALRDLVNSDTFERLMTAARVWAAGADAPPA